MSGCIITVSGKAGHGKDTCGAILRDLWGFKRYAFADRIKEIAPLIGWDGKKDLVGRKLLQEIGKRARDYNQNFWVDYVLGRILAEMPGNVVITDRRFPNEGKRVSEFAEKHGYKVFHAKVIRPGYLSPEMDKNAANDESETALDNSGFSDDFVWMNDCEDDPKRLEKQIIRSMSKFMNRPRKVSSDDAWDKIPILDAQTVSREMMSDVIATRIRASGNTEKMLVSTDFDDTLLVKTKKFISRGDFLSRIMSAPGTSFVIVSARNPQNPKSIPDILDFCRSRKIMPAAIVVNARDKASVLDAINPTVHFEDDVIAVRQIIEKTSVPVMVPGEFLSERFVKNDWLAAIDEELVHYTPNGMNALMEARLSACGKNTGEDTPEKKNSKEEMVECEERIGR